MIKFTYQIDKGIKPNKLSEHLQYRGEHGWELVAFELVEYDQTILCIFKHEINHE